MKKVITVILSVVAVVFMCWFNWTAMLGMDSSIFKASLIWSIFMSLQYAGAIGLVYLTNILTKGYIKEVTLRWLQR